MTIETHCAVCGKLELCPSDIDLQVHAQSNGTGAFYEFTCPRCGGATRRPANPRMVQLLLSAGVQARIVEAHPESPPCDAPPLTFDDLIDFHFALEAQGG